MWSLWEEDSAWTDSLLRDIETSFPKMHEGDNSELGAYQVIFVSLMLMFFLPGG